MTTLSNLDLGENDLYGKRPRRLVLAPKTNRFDRTSYISLREYANPDKPWSAVTRLNGFSGTIPMKLGF